MLFWILLLCIASSHVHSSYIPSDRKDFIDHFRGRFYKNAEYSKFAPVVSRVEPGHDAFNGRAHDRPAVSTFKSDQHRSKVVDGFHGALRDDYGELVKDQRDAQVVSDPIPNLIGNPEASLYVEPVGGMDYTDVNVGDIPRGYGLRFADEPHVSIFSPPSVTSIPKAGSSQVYTIPQVFSSYAPASPFVERLPVARDSNPILQVFPSYVPASPFANDLPVAGESKPISDVSYQFVAGSPPSLKLVEIVANGSFPQQAQGVHDDYVFSAPTAGASSYNDQSEKLLFVPPQSKNIQFVAPMVNYTAQQHPPLVERLPLAHVRKPSLEESYQFAVQPSPSSEQVGVADRDGLSDGTDGVSDDYLFSAPIAGPAAYNDQSEKLLFVPPVFGAPAKPQSENIKFVAPIVNSPSQQHPPLVERLPLTHARKPSLEDSYRFAAHPSSFSEHVGVADSDRLSDGTEGANNDYAFSAPTAGVSAYSDQADNFLFVPPVFAKPQSEDIQFVAPIVNYTAQQHPPLVERLPLTHVSKPNLDESYQFAAQPSPSSEQFGVADRDMLSNGTKGVSDDYVFSAPNAGSSADNGKSENSLFAAPVFGAPAKAQSENIQFVAPIVDSPSLYDSYQFAAQSSPTEATSKCGGKANGSKMSIATCRRYYSECINGEAVPRFCQHSHEVFSSKAGGCVLKESAEECRKVVSETEKVAEEGVVQGKEFCSQRSNGFYGHPSNCSRILQCFDHELFEYPPCDHNLAFDESKGVCDYREHVDNCADVQSSSNAVSSISSETSAEGCGDNKHGDYVRHPQDCSTFFRCVWDRLLPMSCPDGTVFNPSLDVCDFPDQVKGCN